MNTRVSQWLLWPRAFCVGFLTVALGAIGHVVADGGVPDLDVLAMLLMFSVLGAAPLLTRPAGRRRIVGMTVGGQVLAHGALTFSGGGHGADGAMSHGHHTPLPSGADSVSTVLVHLGAHAPMAALHLVAAALVGLWLAHGERCLWTIVAFSARRVFAALLGLPPTLTVGPATFPRAVINDDVPVSRRQSRPRSRRGPPLLSW